MARTVVRRLRMRASLRRELPMDLPLQVVDNPLLRACVEACDSCQRTLRDAVRGGADGTFVPAMRRLMLDCAEICQATASYACAGSVFLPDVVVACVRLCDECGAACEARPNDAAMDACAEACRRCARACFALTARLGRRAGALPHPVP